MQRGIGTVLGLAALGGSLLGLSTVRAAGQVNIEKGLLGIRILQTYRDVYRKFGQPDRVYRTDQVVDLVEALDAKGNPTGGIRGLDLNAAQTAQNNRGGMPGYPGLGGRGMGGPPFGAGGPGGYPGMGGRGMGGPPGYPGMSGAPFGGGRPAGLPGAGGAPFGAGGYPGMGGNNGIGSRRTGQAATGGPGGEETFRDSGGYVWAYFNPKQELVYTFIFNNDGRVEIISEYGRSGGDRTQKGIGLGTSAQAVYNAYGWPSSTEQNGRYFSLFYGPTHHVQVTLLNNKVVGVSVMLREDQKIIRIDRGGGPNSTPFGGRGPMGGRPFGGPGGAPFGGGGPFGGRGPAGGKGED